MSDRREDIIKSLLESKYFTMDDYSEDFVKDAMDEYFKERALELMDFIARRTINYVIENGVPEFLYKGEWITKEQLFENFL